MKTSERLAREQELLDSKRFAGDAVVMPKQENPNVVTITIDLMYACDASIKDIITLLNQELARRVHARDN